MRKSRGNRSGVDNNLRKSVPIALVVVAVMVGGFAAVNNYIETNKYNFDDKAYIWDNSFVDWGVEEESIGIIYNENNTSNETYDSAKKAARQLLSANKAQIENVDNGLEITEDIYMDGKVSEMSGIKASSKFVEAAVVYYDGMVIITEINEEGDIATAVGASTSTGIRGFGLNELVPNLVEKDWEVKKTSIKGDEITEEDYLIAIKVITEAVGTNKADGWKKDLVNKAPRFFTAEGKKAVESSVRAKGISEDFEVVYIEAGRSELGNSIKDRILLVMKNNGEYDFGILKVNREGKIFDADII